MKVFVKKAVDPIEAIEQLLGIKESINAFDVSEFDFIHEKDQGVQTNKDKKKTYIPNGKSIVPPTTQKSLLKEDRKEKNTNNILQTFVNDFEDVLSDAVKVEKEYNPNKERTVSRGMNAEKSNVNHPNHYNTGKYECIEVMEEVFGKEAVELFCIMNSFKYIWRYNKKNGEEDIEKAYNYLKIRADLNSPKE